MNDNIENVSSSSKSVDTSTVKMYNLSGNRDVIVSRHNVIVSDEISKKFVNLSLQRWAKLSELTPDIDTAVERILKKEEGVFYRRHLGATWFVTIRSGMWYVRRYSQVLQLSAGTLPRWRRLPGHRRGQHQRRCVD